MRTTSISYFGSARMEADHMMLWKRFALSDELSPSIGIASVAIQCILYGMHLILAAFTVYVLGSAGFKTWTRAPLLLTTLITIITATIYVALSLDWAVKLLTPADGVYASSWGLTPFELALELLPNINYICSDGILIWRAIGAALNPGLNLLSRMEIRDRSIFSAWVLSLSTNLVATGLIGFKAWRYRRTIKVNLGDTSVHSRTSAPKIMLLLIESGVLYCLFWMLLIGMNVSFATEVTMNLNVRFTGSILQDASVQLSGIYPITIIVLVALRKSVADILLTEPDLSTFQAGGRSGLRPPPQSISFPQSMSFATRSTPTGIVRSGDRNLTVDSDRLYDERDMEVGGKPSTVTAQVQAPRSEGARPEPTVANLNAGLFGDPMGWTFGSPETNYLDRRQCLEDIRNDPNTKLTMLSLPNDRGREERWKEIENNVLAMDTKVYGAHPDSDDRSVRWTHFEKIRGGTVWFTIRWWSGGDLGYYFDLVDVPNRRLLSLRKDLPNLVVAYKYMFTGDTLRTIEEETRRAHDGQELEGTGEERYLVPHGSQLYFYHQCSDGPRLRIATVPTPVPEPVYEGYVPETFNLFHD
ncbi:uncharacterized protein STEHIDRAFT_154886 [Stereum hirsutum FP-91666 SS1]|uniref:uncharacterized protein n=1 Tax=Stereum hirsutum (strain FP-91666) TaxID=721885 RepID=UPI000440B4AF|nr:uncharacterized protein STEHIDRAFT_154886 [Stereum hirsutum FP-91666 SS1]EIM89207.1 hypothetical protein STEHIDRAFT_154886 [Stereum hirsutum FP-91666 SS1]